MPDVTTEQLALLHHTLGLRPDRRAPFRNHYVAGPGHYAMDDLQALESAGLMVRGRTPGFCDPTDVVYLVTEQGKSLALRLLPPEPKKNKFCEYLDLDYSDGFGAFLLGAKKPKFEDRRVGEGWEYRMYRCRYSEHHREIKGEWMPTKKAAKASYKEALKAARQQSKEAA